MNLLELRNFITALISYDYHRVYEKIIFGIELIP